MRSHLLGVLLVLGLGLALRVLWVSLVRPDPTDGRFDDTVFYRGAAHFLAHGDGYVNPFSGTPTALWPPGYPFFLAAVFKVFGEGSAQTSAANVVLSVATIAVVYAIGARLFDRRTALVAAAAMAVWPGQIYFTSLGLSEPLFTLLFALAIFLILAVPESDGGRWAAIVAAGAAIGLATLTRSQGAVLLLLPIVAWRLAGMRWREAIGWSAACVTVAALVLGAWAIRNERTMGTVSLATSTGGNLLLGHHEGASGRTWPSGTIPLTERGTLGVQEYEVRANDDEAATALQYARAHPRDEVTLAGAKIRATYESDATALDWIWGYEVGGRSETHVEFLRRLANAFWFAALALAGCGLLFAWRRMRGPAAILPLLVLLWTTAHVVFFGDPRFHYPIVFVFALLSAHCVVTMVDSILANLPSVRGRPTSMRSRGLARRHGATHAGVSTSSE